jgi:hypothetical protein
LFYPITILHIYEFFRHEVSSWQCAQNCFDRADVEDSFTEELSSSYRKKRGENSLGKFEMLEFQISRHLYDYCSKRYVSLAKEKQMKTLTLTIN